MEESQNRLIDLERLRSEIWQIALEATDESDLIQSLLNQTGSRLQCENISFLTTAPDQKNLIIHKQWRADGLKIGIGEKIPKWAFQPYRGQPWVQVSFSSVPFILKPFILMMQTRRNTTATLIIPYGDPASPEGYICLSQYSEDRLFNKQEIGLIIELARIIGLRSDQLKTARDTEISLNKFKILINNLQMGVLVESAARTIVHVNQQFCDLFGIPSPDVLINMDCSTAAQGAAQLFQYPDLFQKRIAQILSEGRTVTNEELLLKDGRIFSRDYIPVQAAAEFHGNMWLYHDITAGHHLEKQVIRQERLAAIGQISAGLAHEFNNILTSLLGFSDLLGKIPELPELARSYLGQIQQSGQRAANMVRQIMDFSRQSIRRPQLLDLSEKIEDVVTSLRADFPLRIHFTFETEPGPFPILADENQIKQMITHLIRNAMDAIETRGQIRISMNRVELNEEVTCSVCSQVLQGSWFRFAVSDTGSGIPPEILPRIFEPFFSTKGVGKGTGLGLPQITGITAQTGGHLSVESAPGKGTVFSIYLPQPAKNAEQGEKIQKKLEKGKEAGLLLIEPDPAVLKVTRSITEFLDYRVYEARNLSEGWEILKEKGLDIKIVLCNLEFQNHELENFLHGIEAISSTPRFAFICDEFRMEQYKIKFHGLNPAWIQKPILIEQMSSVLHQLLT